MIASFSGYLIIFDSAYIEVRQVETGRLVQFTPFMEARCVWASQLPAQLAETPNEENEAAPNIDAITVTEEIVDGKAANVQRLVELVLAKAPTQ